MLLSLLTYACKKEKDTVEEAAYQFAVPDGFPMPVPDPKNPMSKAGIALGKHLYYDTALSYGGPQQGMACASCHFQSSGFALPGSNVLPHCNLAWNSHFLWRGDIEGTVENIMLFEVNDFFQVDMSRVNANAYYRDKFREVFGQTSITDTLMARALAQFIRTLVSANSPYDQYLKSKVSLSESARRGMDIFFSEKGDCFHCHGNALFSDNSFHNIGLTVKSQADMGRYLVTGSASDVGKFKTPGLRNVALRTVYMHDGRFKSLREVIEHYNSGVRHGEFLDPLLDKPPLGLSETDMNDLENFLKTLTDNDFITNKELGP